MVLLAGPWLGGSRGAEKPGLGGRGPLDLSIPVVASLALSSWRWRLGVWSGTLFVMWRRMKGYMEKEGVPVCGVPVSKKKQTVIHLPVAVSQFHEDS